MPADHLRAVPDRLTERVEATLAEATTTPPTGELAEAIAIYRAAGRSALQRHTERDWFQARITPTYWATAETTFAERIAARLDRLHHESMSWWFLRKHPDWRLRVKTRDHHTLATLLDDLVADNTILSWRAGIYEPETAAFGGTAAIDVVHDLFSADSRGVLTYVRQPEPGLGRRALSLLLLQALHQDAGLDPFETADVYHRVAQLRPTPADTGRVQALATMMRPLLSIPVTADLPLFTPDGPAAHARPWLAGFLQAGTSLGNLAATGQLERGLRAVLAHIVIFHWNRLGLSATTQGVLAHAAKTAFLHGS